MNNNYQVIILIIASDDTDYYINMQKIWILYMNTHPNIKAFFIRSTNFTKQNKAIEKKRMQIEAFF